MFGGPNVERLCEGSRLLSAARKRVDAVESAEGFQYDMVGTHHRHDRLRHLAEQSDLQRPCLL